VFQWGRLEDATALGIIPSGADQFNSLHDRPIEGWKTFGHGRTVHS